MSRGRCAAVDVAVTVLDVVPSTRANVVFTVMRDRDLREVVVVGCYSRNLRREFLGRRVVVIRSVVDRHFGSQDRRAQNLAVRCRIDGSWSVAAGRFWVPSKLRAPAIAAESAAVWHSVWATASRPMSTARATRPISATIATATNGRMIPRRCFRFFDYMVISPRLS